MYFNRHQLKYDDTSVHKVNLFHASCKVAILVFMLGRWAQQCSSPYVEFVKGNKILPNLSVCKPNVSRTEECVN